MHSDNETQTKLHWWKDRKSKGLKRWRGLRNLYSGALQKARGEERLKEAMPQYLRLRFLPWWDYSAPDWPEPSMIPTCDCYICLGVGLVEGRGEADSECYGEDGGRRARDPFPKSHKVLAQITSPTSRSSDMEHKEDKNTGADGSSDLAISPFHLKSKPKIIKIACVNPWLGGILLYSQ